MRLKKGVVKKVSIWGLYKDNRGMRGGKELLCPVSKKYWGIGDENAALCPF